ncbi:MAG: EF-P beta-lysylation protein EpmB [Gammaproteobacteria bacterium]|nr:EF-P beta-lysylation protein EpmB [Gammaproteobacteria bacterium]
MQKNLSYIEELQQAITDPLQLLAMLKLEPGPKLLTTSDFPFMVPRPFAARMQKGNQNDPLLCQVLPTIAETQKIQDFSQDPLDEKGSNPMPGLLHKYYGRVLLTLTGSCALNCRFCFRRHFPYQCNNFNSTAILDYIASDPTINEVILSGGEPLLLSDQELVSFSTELEKIPHLKYLRIHTRMPIAIPARITTEFVNWLKNSKLQPIVVIHCNHPQEIDAKVKAAMLRLHCAGITLFNQTVLLKGINDAAETLINLSKQLFSMKVLPYYIHLLDKVEGAAHFAIKKDRALALMQEITARLPGFLVPKLVYEKSGEAAKTRIY